MPNVRYGHFVSLGRKEVITNGEYPFPEQTTDFGLENKSPAIVFLRRAAEEDKYQGHRVSSNGFRAIVPRGRNKKMVVIKEIKGGKRGLTYKIEQR